jgi:hypothetical protein
VRPARESTTSLRRVVPAPDEDTIKDASKSDAAPTKNNTDSAERDASRDKTVPAPLPAPPAPEEYDFRTRIEIITEPEK